MGATVEPTLVSFLPLLILSLMIGLTSFFLAKEKGRNVPLWTILGIIPVLNIGFIWYAIGAANLKIEKKLDQIISRLSINV